MIIYFAACISRGLSKNFKGLKAIGIIPIK